MSVSRSCKIYVVKPSQRVYRRISLEGTQSFAGQRTVLRVLEGSEVSGCCFIYVFFGRSFNNEKIHMALRLMCLGDSSTTGDFIPKVAATSLLKMLICVICFTTV